jgi:TorA maturation chaperone TorD
MSAALAADVGVGEEELLRARVYALLAQALAAPLDGPMLTSFAVLHGDGSEFGLAIAALADSAARATPETAADEYQELFIGIDRGELVPYGSFYLTGFLHERPLADLRADLEALGIERAEGVSEPEDHIAALCETMAGLIAGSFGEPADIPTQQRFFERHLASWADRFFADLENADAARLYRPLGTIGRLFLDIERKAFEMAG